MPKKITLTMTAETKSVFDEACESVERRRRSEVIRKLIAAGLETIKKKRRKAQSGDNDD